MRSSRVTYIGPAALMICLALGVAACGGGGDSGGSAPKPQRQPIAVTGLPGNVSETDAEVSAKVNPNDAASTTYYFEYGTSTTYGDQTQPEPVSGNKDETVTADLTNLEADTTYHYRVVARTGSGTLIKGNDQTFTTASPEGDGGGGGGESDGASGNAPGTTGNATGGGTTGKSTGGYTTTPPPSTGGYTTTPPPSTGGYTTTPPASTGGYTTTPPASTGR
jgi:hypothetical protein